jgi:hypothetical protein
MRLLERAPHPGTRAGRCPNAGLVALTADRQAALTLGAESTRLNAGTQKQRGGGLKMRPEPFELPCQ